MHYWQNCHKWQTIFVIQVTSKFFVIGKPTKAGHNSQTLQVVVVGSQSKGLNVCNLTNPSAFVG